MQAPRSPAKAGAVRQRKGSYLRAVGKPNSRSASPNVSGGPGDWVDDDDEQEDDSGVEVDKDRKPRVARKLDAKPGKQQSGPSIARALATIVLLPVTFLHSLVSTSLGAQAVLLVALLAGGWFAILSLSAGLQTALSAPLRLSGELLRSAWGWRAAPWDVMLREMQLQQLGAPILHGVTAISCAMLGVGCRDSKQAQRERVLGYTARAVTTQATQALGVFESVMALSVGSPSDLGLHHVELWELSVAVRTASEMEGKDFLSDRLEELGDLTRDVRDEVGRITSLGMSSFTWILQEFARVETAIATAQREGSTDKAAAKLQKKVDGLFDRIAKDLSDLLKAIDKALPPAENASILGGRLLTGLSSERARLRREDEERSILQRLTENRGYKGRQLRRDVDLAEVSVDSVKEIRRSLEHVRRETLAYSDNVGHLKAGITGFHLGSDDLDPANEIAGLRTIMQEFGERVTAAKHGRKMALSG